MKKRLWSMSLVFCAFLAACGSDDSAEKSESSGTNTAEAEELVEVKQVTNWFAEAEHGGQYAAVDEGIYEEYGLDMTIEPGGPQVSGIQLVAAGSADFAMAHADEVLLAREQGIPVVAISTIFQTNPIAFMSHTEEPLKSAKDLNNRKVYILPGQPFWDYIKNTQNLEGVTELAYTGSLATFLNDTESINQGYVTNEGYVLEQEGITFSKALIADMSGYNPYANMLITTEDYIKENPEIVQDYIDASKKGWDFFKENYEKTNEYINSLNPDYTMDMLNYAAEQSQPLIWTEETDKNGFGYMSEERWETLKNQLVEAGLISESLDVSKAYTTEFID